MVIDDFLLDYNVDHFGERSAKNSCVIERRKDMLDCLQPTRDGGSVRIMLPPDGKRPAPSRISHHHNNNNHHVQAGNVSPMVGQEEDSFGDLIPFAVINQQIPKPDLVLIQSSEDSDSTTILDSPPNRRRYQAYTVIQRSGFQHTEYVQIISHLCRAEILISLIFLAHGLACPGFQEDSVYQGTCHINVLAALVGIFTGGVGLGAVNRFRWKNVLVMWLLLCIISSVANLLAVITTGVWLDHLSKMKERTGIANGLSGMMLLGSVLVGVCFILTAVLICHYWASNSTKYQAVGRMAKRTKSIRRRSSRASSGTERSKSSHKALDKIPSQKPQYHIV